MNKTIVDAFIENALTFPDKVAIRCGEKFFTYKDLDVKSSILADLLIKQPVSNNQLIPILIEPGIEIVIGILGVLKAGAAYIPIDSEFPVERINMIIKETEPLHILTTSALEIKIHEQYRPRCILLDRSLPKRFSRKIKTISPNLANTESLAYIIYTSGSTGNPKGVMIEHIQLYSYIKSIIDELSLEKCESFAILGTFAADAGHTALFCTLKLGKSLDIINLKKIKSYDILKAHFEKHPVDCYKITPSVADLFLQFEDVQSLLPKRVLILGGESCPYNIAKGILKKLPRNCSLINHYGPTETTVGVITYRFSKKTSEIPRKVPLGRPLDGVEIFILNKNYKKVQKGAKGELFLAGSLLGRGYFKDSKLTDQKFITLKINGTWKRLYKTGDFVKISSDGNVLYLGREDEQVKLNGHRIELKEIEAVIGSSRLINKCIITLVKFDNGKEGLACYLVPESNYDETKLKTYCSEKLPSYMIPSYWTVLDRLPLSLNNKINKRALPPITTLADNDILYTIKQADILNDLIRMWKKTLSIDKIGLSTDFFYAGGNSLLLIKLGFEIQKKFKAKLSYQDLLQSRTIWKQASKINKALLRDKKKDNRFSRNQNRLIEVTESQKILYFQNKLNPTENFPNSTITFKIEGDLDLQKLKDTINFVAKKNESLNTSFSFKDGKVKKEFNAFKEINIRVIHSQKCDIDQIIFDNLSSFNLSNAPLICVSIFYTGNGCQFLHIDMPHIISDGYSLKIFMEQLKEYYQKNLLIKGHLQFSDFQSKRNDYLSSKRFLSDQVFWYKIAKAFDYSPPKNMNIKSGIDRSLNGISIVEYIGNQNICNIDYYIKENKLTRFQFFLISYIIFLHLEFDLSSVAIMIPVHNRNHLGFDQIIGLLSNIVMINIKIDNKYSLKSFIKSCKSMILEVLSRSEYPFENFAECLSKRRISLKQAASLFFSYNDHDQVLKLGGASLHLHVSKRNKENLPLSIAIFDLGTDVAFRLASRIDVFNEVNLYSFGSKFKNLCLKLPEVNELSELISITSQI